MKDTITKKQLDVFNQLQAGNPKIPLRWDDPSNYPTLFVKCKYVRGYIFAIMDEWIYCFDEREGKTYYSYKSHTKSQIFKFYLKINYKAKLIIRYLLSKNLNE